MATSIHAGDLIGTRLVELAKLTAVDMTTAAVYNVLNNGPQTLILTHVAMGSFSAYPTSQNLPAAFAFSWGLNSSTTPNDMRASLAFGAGIPAPFVIAMNVTSAPCYIPPGKTLYFAVVTTTGAVGTMNVAFIGGILAK